MADQKGHGGVALNGRENMGKTRFLVFWVISFIGPALKFSEMLDKLLGILFHVWERSSYSLSHGYQTGSMG